MHPEFRRPAPRRQSRSCHSASPAILADGPRLDERGRLYFAAGQWEEARRDLTAALKLLPDNADGLLRSRCETNWGPTIWPSPIRARNRTLSNGRRWVTTIWGWNSIIRNRHQEALEPAQPGHRARRPNVTCKLENRGEVFQARENSPRPSEDYSQAIDLKVDSPDFANALYLRGQCSSK